MKSIGAAFLQLDALPDVKTKLIKKYVGTPLSLTIDCNYTIDQLGASWMGVASIQPSLIMHIVINLTLGFTLLKINNNNNVFI